MNAGSVMLRPLCPGSMPTISPFRDCAGFATADARAVGCGARAVGSAWWCAPLIPSTPAATSAATATPASRTTANLLRKARTRPVTTASVVRRRLPEVADGGKDPAQRRPAGEDVTDHDGLRATRWVMSDFRQRCCQCDGRVEVVMDDEQRYQAA